MRSNESAFDDVFSRVARRGDDRRHYQRRTGAFELRWAASNGVEARTWAAVGTEISANGVVFVSPDRVGADELDVTFFLSGRLVAAQVRVIRQDRVVLGGLPMYRCACEFCGVLADDWEAIERYANGEERSGDAGAAEERKKARAASDAYLLLPSELKRKIVEALIAEERLEPAPPDAAPKLELYYGGAIDGPGERRVHRLHVHSRKRAAAGVIAYDTRFLVGDDGALQFA